MRCGLLSACGTVARWYSRGPRGRRPRRRRPSREPRSCDHRPMPDLRARTAWSSPDARCVSRSFDTAATHGYDKDDGRAETTAEQLDRLADLQDRFWAEAKRSVLVVLQGIDAAGKDGTIKQGHGGVQPAGLPGHGVQGAQRRGARPRLPVAGPQARSRARARSASSTARTTRTSSSSASTTSCPRRSGRSATTRSTPSSGSSPTTARRSSSSSCRSTGRAARAVPGALRRPDEALEVLDGRPRGAQALGRLPGGVRRRPARRRRRPRRRGTSSRRTASGSANLAVSTILADTLADLKPAYPAPRGPAAGPRHRVAPSPPR